jgi:hypothetical protein
MSVDLTQDERVRLVAYFKEQLVLTKKEYPSEDAESKEDLWFMQFNQASHAVRSQDPTSGSYYSHYSMSRKAAPELDAIFPSASEEDKGWSQAYRMARVNTFRAFLTKIRPGATATVPAATPPSNDDAARREKKAKKKAAKAQEQAAADARARAQAEAAAAAVPKSTDSDSSSSSASSSDDDDADVQGTTQPMPVSQTSPAPTAPPMVVRTSSSSSSSSARHAAPVVARTTNPVPDIDLDSLIATMESRIKKLTTLVGTPASGVRGHGSVKPDDGGEAERRRMHALTESLHLHGPDSSVVQELTWRANNYVNNHDHTTPELTQATLALQQLQM